MQAVTKAVLGFFLLASTALAQTITTSPPKTAGTIAGRVTAGAAAVAGVEVILKPGGATSVTDVLQAAPAPTATTDADGAYKLVGVAPGSYQVVAYAPAFVSDEESTLLTPGKTVKVGEGEQVENINFTLTRGGVLTGKVTDPEGHPVISEFVLAYKVNAEGKRHTPSLPDFNIWQTDDRGVYRIYGLAPGRYLIAAGTSNEAEDMALKMMTGGRGDNYFRRTFYPEATDEARAKIVEVKAGGEVENLDITLAVTNKNKTFAVAGRVIEAASGQPVAGVMIGYTGTKADEPSFGFGGAATNAAGEFRLEGLKPNSYKAFVMSLGASENYGEPLSFEVISSDLTGLEIKMHPGASISGVAVIEGAADPKLREKLTKVILTAISVGGEQARDVASAFGGTGQIAANGTFKISGVRPGKVGVMANAMMAEKGFSLARIEYNGVEVKELPVHAGDRLTGVRLVFAYNQEAK